MVSRERALESQLKLATSSLPPHARSMGASLSNALQAEVLTRAVECSLAVAQDPSNTEARLAALAAVAEVKSVASALVDVFQNVYPYLCLSLIIFLHAESFLKLN